MSSFYGNSGGAGGQSDSSLKNIKDAENGGVVEGLLEMSDGVTGTVNTASGKNSHAEGGRVYSNSAQGTTASGYASHAEGVGTTASGDHSHTEGRNTTASATNSHAEGIRTQATNCPSHAEGYETVASGISSHAEGENTTASGKNGHSEGTYTTASGQNSHTEGNHTTASGRNSHTEGSYTTANHANQHVFGEFNLADPSISENYQRGNYIEIVGNGTSDQLRSNARTLDWSGNESLAGGLTLGKGTADEITITAAQLKALLALLN